MDYQISLLRVRNCLSSKIKRNEFQKKQNFYLTIHLNCRETYSNCKSKRVFNGEEMSSKTFYEDSNYPKNKSMH